jgi:hypothetical protein
VGERDLDARNGSWRELSSALAAALQFAGYQHQFHLAAGGGHTLRFQGQHLASCLTWLFADSGDSCSASGSRL